MDLKKNYRKNVAAVILSSNYPSSKDIFLAKRNDMRNAWQFPQGGVDKEEGEEEALFRELKEEIGTNDIEIISQYPKWLYYDFPKNIINKMKPYDGQMQRYYLIKLNNENKINLKTKKPEFISYKFAKYDDILDETVYFKKKIYSLVLSYFREKGYI